MAINGRDTGVREKNRLLNFTYLHANLRNVATDLLPGQCEKVRALTGETEDDTVVVFNLYGKKTVSTRQAVIFCLSLVSRFIQGEKGLDGVVPLISLNLSALDKHDPDCDILHDLEQSGD